MCRKNSQNEKTIRRNLATDSRRDQDFVSAAFVVDAVRNDKIDLYLADFSGEGLKNLMFCGYYIGSWDAYTFVNTLDIFGFNIVCGKNICAGSSLWDGIIIKCFVLNL